MEYIKEINAFERWLETNTLSSTAQLLWYKLMYINNRSGWQEWISVDNYRLVSSIGVSEKTLINAREQLIQNELIEFKKGKKGFPNKYKIVTLYCKFYSTNDSTIFSTNDSTIFSTNFSHNRQRHRQILNKDDDNILNINKKSIGQSSSNPKEQEVIKFYTNNISLMPSSYEVDKLMSWADTFELDLMLKALEIAVENNNRSFKYVEGIFKNWEQKGIKTLEQYKANESLRNSNKQNQSNSSKSRFVNYEQRDVDASKMRELERKMLKKDLEKIGVE